MSGKEIACQFCLLSFTDINKEVDKIIRKKAKRKGTGDVVVA